MRHNPESNQDQYIHQPVLWREILAYIEDSPLKGEGLLVDCTLGEGGHSRLILEKFPGISIVAFERDTRILEVARERLASYGDRIRFVNDNFRNLAEHLEDRAGKIAYMLFDFGISSFHYERSQGGFGFALDEPLDMRLDSSAKHDASYMVNRYNEKDLADIFYLYGEERKSRRIASRICRERQKSPIETTGQLAEVVLRAIPREHRVKNIHPATRVFQALRIAVNDELEAIKGALRGAPFLLEEGGRIMAISFHSLEDRIVKDRFRRLAHGCTCDNEPKYCQCGQEPLIKILTKKPLEAAMDELEANNRARSARLRVAQRL